MGVGTTVGAGVGVTAGVGVGVGTTVGAGVGVTAGVGVGVGTTVGAGVGATVSTAVRAAIGTAIGVRFAIGLAAKAAPVTETERTAAPTMRTYVLRLMARLRIPLSIGSSHFSLSGDPDASSGASWVSPRGLSGSVGL